jgi:hypothetical protein
LHYLLVFKRGFLEAILSKNTLGPLGVNDRKEHGFLNQLVGTKLFKHAKGLEEVEDIKDIWE